MASLSPESLDAPPRRRRASGEPRSGRRGQRERVRLIAEVVAAYIQARRELRRAPIETVVARLRSQPSPERSSGSNPLQDARDLGWIVTRTLALVPGDTRCLARSLVLTKLLARRGIPAKLVIGARTTPEFFAHAWVEQEGVAVLAPGDATFGRLVEL